MTSSISWTDRRLLDAVRKIAGPIDVRLAMPPERGPAPRQSPTVPTIWVDNRHTLASLLLNWDPWFGVWTFLPGDGIFYSPFGWGFYSPLVVYRSAFYYGGYYDHVPHHFSDFHYPFGHGFEPTRGFRAGGFRGGTVPRVGGNQR